MEDKLLNYASCLAKGENVLEVLLDLEKILEENGLYSELISCKEKIWHLNNDDNLLKKMAVLYRQKENNPDMAYIINMLYIKRTDPDLYEELVGSLDGKEFPDLNPNFDENTDNFTDLLKIVDRYCALKFIAALFFMRKKYDEFAKLMPFFSTVKDAADEYLKNNPDADTGDLELIDETNAEIAQLLASDNNNIQINELAIKFDGHCLDAYINIISSYINNDEQQAAFDFYNNEFHKEFEEDKVNSFTDVMWKISSLYFKQEDYYKSLCIQKKILDMEISKGQE